ncbi:hypothetical protein [Mariniblastus fucicola]|uniref:hypothetical protein n=1 Tax=Mariniblastus fucicola TaxID=980251 RepID=UPI0011DF20CD|nr:hypothetical protein [Mariniblastus fucicola]
MICTVVIGGCGDGGRPYHAVRGVVKFNKDDSTARFGMIEFRSESEPIVTARSTINKDGTFSLRTGDREGAVAGWHTVVIMQSVQNLHGKVKHDHGLEAASKYLDHRKTDLRVEVTEATAEEDLILKIDHLPK